MNLIKTGENKDGISCYTGLTPEETEIHKRLTEKLKKVSKIDEKVKEPEPQDISSQIIQTYSGIFPDRSWRCWRNGWNDWRFRRFLWSNYLWIFINSYRNLV